ncbi:sugar phosphate isomerase/epimerase family protein [Alloiococcus sp. CFN-8]|uniref:sugar phosphate isomerase/epimerase family protein n=1 Tax=Alloiococcus sp. CFN-8 TaxID=3416081 RepID=UPI003CF825A4
MSIYVSHLVSNKDILSIKERYAVGIEIVNFASALSLDNKDEELDVLFKGIGNHLTGKVSVHGPYSDMSPGSPDRKIRRVTMDRFQECYELASGVLKAERIVFHSGFIPKLSYDLEWLKYSKEFWEEFLQDKQEDGIKIHIENVFEEDYKLLCELVDYINKPNFSICLDIGHKNACSTLSLEQWVKAMGKRIGYVHLHNNDGKGDLHNPLEEGTINMPEALKLLKEYSHEAAWCLEVFSKGGIESSLDYLIDCGYL